ncbi:MAG: phage antirepressor N-terminal domain-containing protein [Chloroflexota bacterium]
MSQDDRALAPSEQKTVVFYEDEITVVVVDESGEREIYVPLRPMTELLGVSWPSQTRRLQNDPVLAQVVTPVVVMTSGGPQEMTAIPLDYLQGWLFGINASRVKESIRERVVRYQRECYQVLHEAFQEGRLSGDSDFEELIRRSSSEAVEAYQIAQAMVKLARNQIMLEGRLEDHEERLEQLEISLGDPKHHITPDQASRISQAVKAVAHELGKRTKRNEYGGVYGELYRRYSINSYKELPADKYEDAMGWLNEWLQSLIDEAPF